MRKIVSRPRCSRSHSSGTCRNGRSRTTSLPAISTSMRASPRLLAASLLEATAGDDDDAARVNRNGLDGQVLKREQPVGPWPTVSTARRRPRGETIRAARTSRESPVSPGAAHLPRSTKAPLATRAADAPRDRPRRDRSPARSTPRRDRRRRLRRWPPAPATAASAGSARAARRSDRAPPLPRRSGALPSARHWEWQQPPGRSQRDAARGTARRARYAAGVGARGAKRRDDRPEAIHRHPADERDQPEDGPHARRIAASAATTAGDTPASRGGASTAGGGVHAAFRYAGARGCHEPRRSLAARTTHSGTSVNRTTIVRSIQIPLADETNSGRANQTTSNV